jgi:beta-lactamase superfamily II metal-dependent hydrolase
MIKVKMFPAEDGDSILLHLGKEDDFNLLIDMGREITYSTYIKKELENLKSKGRILNLLVITHLDADHIDGALPFLCENGHNNNVIEIGEIWHNTYRHMQFEKQDLGKTSNHEQNALKAIINQNSRRSTNLGLNDTSIQAAISLGGLIIKNSYNWNTSFFGSAVCTENQPTIFNFPFNLTLLSPTKRQLTSLKTKWLNKLKEIFFDFQISDEQIFDDAFEYYLKRQKQYEHELSNVGHESNRTPEYYAYIEKKDTSKENASSIAFIIEYGKFKMLFLADANADAIYESLYTIKKRGIPLLFDLVKISHHGAARNTSTKLLSILESKRYLISTNGYRNNHPSKETISKILVKPTSYKKELIFNYRLESMKYLEDYDLQIRYNYSVSYMNEIELT